MKQPEGFVEKGKELLVHTIVVFKIGCSKVKFRGTRLMKLQDGAVLKTCVAVFKMCSMVWRP